VSDRRNDDEPRDAIPPSEGYTCRAD